MHESIGRGLVSGQAHTPSAPYGRRVVAGGVAGGDGVASDPGN